MPIFGSNSGPQLQDVKVTLENLCALVDDPLYQNGVTSDGVVNMLQDLYKYISGDKNKRIRCPAPADNPDDRYRMMWPEGAKVTSRPSSVTSSRNYNIRRLSTEYNDTARRRAASVTSSGTFTSRYVGIIDEEESVGPLDTEPQSVSIPFSITNRHKAQPHGSAEVPNALRVGGTLLKPSKSMQDIINGLHSTSMSQAEDDMEDEVPMGPQSVHRTRNNTRRKVPSSGVGFADD